MNFYNKFFDFLTGVYPSLSFKDGDLALKVQTQLASLRLVYLTPTADQPISRIAHVTKTLTAIGQCTSTNISEDAAVTIFYSSALETGIRVNYKDPLYHSAGCLHKQRMAI